MSDINHTKFIVEQVNGDFELWLNIENKKSKLPALWLRERAPTEDQIDHITQQRFVNPHEFDPNIRLKQIEIKQDIIKLEFTDGYSADYQITDIAKWINSDNSYPKKVKWKADLSDIPRYNWLDFEDETYHFQAVQAYLKYGFIIIYNALEKPNSIRKIAAKFGYIRHTNFGEIFEVKTKPKANDLAYYSVALGPHTDNPYRDPTPGIQLLHCLVNQTSGGLSTLVDSLSCLDRLALTNPEGLELLANIPVTFTFSDVDTRIAKSRPIVSKNEKGEIDGMHYSPRLDWLPLLDEEVLKVYQKARSCLSQLLTDHEFELKFKLVAGECMMFDNNRVLHGRTEFNPNEGARHLQGCYIDKDGPEAIYQHFYEKNNRVN